MAIASYLKRTSDRGNYSYRRAVPEDCRSHWGKREHKISLKTKSHPEALRRAAMVNIDFEQRVARIRILSAGKPLPTDQLLQEAKELLKKEGIHPQQIPSTKVEADRFFSKTDKWAEQYLEIGSGLWEDEDFMRGPYPVAYDIIKGRQTSSLIPTLDEATTTYLKINAEKTQRNQHNQRKHEQRVRRAVDQLGQPDEIITDFNRLRARRHMETLQAQNPTWANNTLDRAITILSAIFASAILEYELTMSNPWLNLSASFRVTDTSTSEDRENRRRSFTPNELGQYTQALTHLNQEAQIIGQIMIQTGCRTMEAGGMLVKDLKLGTNVPHMQIKFNRIRKLKTQNSVRDVPLVGFALDLVRDYHAKLDAASPDDPLFPRYGRDGGMDAISALLNGVIRRRLLVSDKNLVAYSTRHTMKDKLRALRTPEDMQHRILGHGARSQADGYGDGNPLVHLQDVLAKADKLEQWGL